MEEVFEAFGLKHKLLQGIFAYGFERPSEIQQKAIPVLCNRRDLIAQAQSGTGKTGAFSIGMLQVIDQDENSGCQGILLSPTRELAEQTYDVISSLGKYMGVRVHLSIGGSSVHAEREKLKGRGVDVICGTPGRVLQMVEEGFVSVASLKLFVLDEADEMLKVGFRDQLIRLFKYIPDTTQCAIFSATLTKESFEVSKRFMVDPEYILVEPEELSLKGINQFYINVSHENFKLDTLLDLYGRLCVSQAIIFANSKRKVNILSEHLRSQGFSVGVMHSEVDTKERNDVFLRFRKGLIRIVITTDIMSRGIDIHGISFVINYDLPRSKETYLHRIGRSGRFGKKGVAINFVTDDDFRDLKALEKFYATTIREMPDDFERFL